LEARLFLLTAHEFSYLNKASPGDPSGNANGPLGDAPPPSNAAAAPPSYAVPPSLLDKFAELIDSVANLLATQGKASSESFPIPIYASLSPAIPVADWLRL
jgi:hypothetical protein